MKRIRLWSTLAATLALLTVGVTAYALNPGDVVVLLLPADENQPEPASGPNDKFIYTGGRITTTDATGCHPNTSAPEQNAVLVDPGPGRGRSGRIVGVVTVAQTGGSNDPVPPGTKLTDLVLEGDCTAGGTAYKRYHGTVE